MRKEITFGEIVSPEKYKKIKNDITYFTSVTNGRIKSPYNGYVVSIKNDKCNGGYCLIKHKINNEYYYSEFCNIGKLMVSDGETVGEGKIIGYFLNNTDKLSYVLYDEIMKKTSPEKFFKTEKKSDDNNKDEESNKRKKRNSGDDEKVDNPYSFIPTKPFQLSDKFANKVSKSFKDAVKDTFSVKSKDDKKDESLNEELRRIKKLL